MENNNNISMSFESRLRSLGWSSVTFVDNKKQEEKEEKDQPETKTSNDYDER